MYLLWQIVIGILAGWLAGKIMRGRGYGVLIDLLLGIVGYLGVFSEARTPWFWLDSGENLSFRAL